MIRLPGILKVVAVLTIDFLAVYALLGEPIIASADTVVIALYVFSGGYLALFKEGAVQSKNLPTYQRDRLEAAKKQLASDVKSASGANISGIKFFLVPGSDEMNATAFGLNCISVTRGTFDNADPSTLNAVLAHEISHILNFDPEFSRAVFATILIFCGAISIISFAFISLIFVIFLVCSFFRCWIGFVAFTGTRRAVGGIFSLFQKGIVVFYRAIAGCLSRTAEYRSDLYAAQLGYGIQLAHFLSCYAAQESNCQLTLTEALYRTHPATPKRIARLEAYVQNEKHLMTK
jgi:Zn-dependent protease with chaperone function